MIFELPLLVFMVMTAAGAILAKDLISAVFILGTYSFTLALCWALLGAVDVAFVEAVVGAGLATVFFLLTLFNASEADTRIRRSAIPWTALIGLPILALLLLYGAADLPAFGDPSSPASTHISPVYLESSVEADADPERRDGDSDGLPLVGHARRDHRDLHGGDRLRAHSQKRGAA